jgi:hypothetical protein
LASSHQAQQQLILVLLPLFLAQMSELVPMLMFQLLRKARNAADVGLMMRKTSH